MSHRVDGYSRLLNHYVNGTTFMPGRWKELVIETNLPLITPSRSSHLAISKLDESSVRLSDSISFLDRRRWIRSWRES